MTKSASNQKSVYIGDEFSFEYPLGGLVTIFVHSDGSQVVRLLGLIKNKQFHMDIEKKPQISNAREEIYRIASVNKNNVVNDMENPQNIKFGVLEGWIYSFRLIDGGNILDHIITAFVQTPDGVFRFTTSASPEQYDDVRIIFKSIINSFTINERNNHKLV